MIALTQPLARLSTPAAEIAYVGQSGAAQDLDRLASEQRGHARQRAVYADLEALWNEANSDQWAGRDGIAMLPGAYWKARDFLEVILSVAPPPELTLDNYGAVEFDWHLAKRWRISISVAGDGGLTYAFRLGERSGSGTEWFHKEVPRSLAELVVEATRREAS